MATENAELRELADRYTAGRMPDAEREAFELRMLGEPELVKEVEVSERMRIGMQHLREGGELALLLQGKERRTPSWVAWSAAASVGIVAAGLALYLTRPDEAPYFAARLEELHLPAGIVVTGPYVLAETRRPGDAMAIDIPREAEAVRIELLPPESTGVVRYRIALFDSNGTRPASEFETSVTESGLVIAYFDAARVETGNYRVAVENLRAGGDVAARAEYPVRFERRD